MTQLTNRHPRLISSTAKVANVVTKHMPRLTVIVALQFYVAPFVSTICVHYLCLADRLDNHLLFKCVLSLGALVYAVCQEFDLSEYHNFRLSPCQGYVKLGHNKLYSRYKPYSTIIGVHLEYGITYARTPLSKQQRRHALLITAFAYQLFSLLNFFP